MLNKKLKIIGRKDKADFPDLGLENIDIKIDTGAYTSSMHAHKIIAFKKNEVPYIKFHLLDPKHPEYKNKAIEAKVLKVKKVKSSIGQSENRYIIKSKILLFNKTYTIELSLTNRSEMKHPVLIGRKLLNNKFLVDTSQKDLSYNAKIKNK